LFLWGTVFLDLARHAVNAGPESQRRYSLLDEYCSRKDKFMTALSWMWTCAASLINSSFSPPFLVRTENLLCWCFVRYHLSLILLFLVYKTSQQSQHPSPWACRAKQNRRMDSFVTEADKDQLLLPLLPLHGIPSSPVSFYFWVSLQLEFLI
jgi:hypothetical protein